MEKKRLNTSNYIVELEKSGILLKSSILKDYEITGVSYDSRTVKPGFIFVCKGVHFKEAFLDSAIKNGAVAYVSEQEYETGAAISSIIVSDVRAAMPVLAHGFYGNLSESINMIGITGTKGKTTCTFLLKSILDDYLTATQGKRSAFCSGIDNYDGVALEESHLTTPEIFELYEHMSNAVNSGIPYMSMEVSSQALKYGRTAGVNFEIAAFLNIGLDHISDNEHKDFEDYFSSKLSIFSQSRRACINTDSDYYERIFEAASVCTELVRFGESNPEANVYTTDILAEDGNVEFDVVIQGIEGYANTGGHIKLATFGKINVRNAVAAIAVAAMLGVPFEYMQSGLSKALVPGRMEVYRDYDDGRIAIVDYAHNALSYQAMLSAISEEFPNRKIILVCGSTGGKAFNRRQEIGEIAGKYCSHVVLTEDDGGEESVVDICKEIASYLGPDCSHEIVPDRPSAIRKALSYADDSNIIISAGKAREHYQKRGGHYVEIESDVDVVQAAFRKNDY